MKVDVGALHRGIGKTQRTAHKEVVYGREHCCGVCYGSRILD